MEYTITNVQERNEWGDGMKDYAIALQGHDGWIKLTQKLQTPPPVIGSTINGRIETKTNTNGKSYLKFTKERVNTFGGGNHGGGTPAESPKLDYIIQMLEELTDRRPVADIPRVEESKDDKLDDPFAGLL